MRTSLLIIIGILGCLLGSPVFSQTDNEEELLGLPGDNLDLFAVLDLFQKSKTIEEFEKSLNAEETGINNLDLNLDDKIDFIKVKTEQKKEDFTFILQVDVTEKEAQDVAVILLSKDKNDIVTLQIVGDKDLYGKNYVVEPQPATPAVTPNPAYTGNEPVPAAAPASTNVVVVESAPIVQYVYSPVYVPYYPPYYYGYYPPYFRATAVIAVGVYHNNYYNHYGYHGGNTVIIHNNNNYNNYYNNRNSSNTVNHNNANGNYNNGNRPTTSNGNRPSTSNVNKPSTGSASKPSASPSTRQSNPSAASRQSSPSQSTRQQPSSSSYGRSGGGRSGGGFSGGGFSGRGGRR